jgi:HEAT repeat protein
MATLIQALCGDDVVSRLSAMVTVSRADAPAVPYLCKFLLERQRPWSVRWSITTALARIGEDSCVPALLAVVGDNGAPGDEWIRHGAVLALGRFRPPDAVPALVERLSDTVTPKDFWPENRICDVAISALSRIETREARAAVAAWRQWHRPRVADHDPAVRLTSAIALAFAGDGAGRSVLLEYMGPGPFKRLPALRGFDTTQVEKALAVLREAPIPEPLDNEGGAGQGGSAAVN